MNNKLNWPARAALFLIVGGVGAFIIGAYAGLYYWPPIRRCRAVFCDPDHWQVLALGVAFFCAGLAFVIPPRLRLIGRLNSVLLVACLLGGVIGAFAAR